MSDSKPTPPAAAPDSAQLSWGELAFLALLIAGGFFFLRDAPHWGRAAYVGSAQFGDAEFWWNGALHFSQGIVADNPNLTYRMGYAALAGMLAAVCGPDYRIFHQILTLGFLLVGCGLYHSLRGTIGRIAAASAVVLLVFNPYTAEWLAISTSDALGLVLNLSGLLALIAGVRGPVRLGWVALFGILVSCASLTRPLMTPFIAPAALAAVIAAWGDWRRVAKVLGVMLGAFVLPTLAWMAFMGATTGNFALTGASQDSSAFYAASDPQIQVWRGDMYDQVKASAKVRHQTEQPTAKQLNAEFWTLTRQNYQRHWRHHLERFWANAHELARFTPQRAGPATPESGRWRTILQWSLAALLTGWLLWQERWATALAVAAIGTAWAAWPAAQPWLVLGAGWLGLTSLLGGNRSLFLWAAYWWVGVAALYLTGGTWGPPLGQVWDLNALGYRLGFQFLPLSDLLVACLLGGIAGQAKPAATWPGWLQPSPRATWLARRATQCALGLLGVVLAIGSVIVVGRLYANQRSRPVPYPDLAALKSAAPFAQSAPVTDITALRVAINAHTGEPWLANAMSSGFIWNLTGQQRSMLLIYQQDHVRPIQMNPRHVYVEISRQLPEREWMNRRGAWVLRSFANTAQNSNLPYYFEMPAVQAFVPLRADGSGYDLDRAIRFPLAKAATQLVASGELQVTGSQPEWAMNSGPQRFPRRFAVRADATGHPITLQLDPTRARGEKRLRFGLQLEPAAAGQAAVNATLETFTPAGPSVPWRTDLTAAAAPLPVEVTVTDASRVLLTLDRLQPGDVVWFYELVMTADDFAQ